MHPLVRDAYRRLLWVGRDYPQGLAFVRARAKAGFLAQAAPLGERELLTAVHRARWWAKELEGVVQLRKYRAMRARYGAVEQAPDKERELEEAFRRDAGRGGGSAAGA